MTSLYVLTGQYKQAEQRLLEMELDPQTIADTLEGLAGDVEEKATNVAMFVRNLESSAEQIKLAEKAMAERRKSLETKAESMKRYLKENMQRTGITKIECPYFAISLKKNPPAVVIDDETAIPDDYKVTPPPPVASPDKKLIAQAIKDGFDVPGAHIEQHERVEIK